jgi:hypothetical protein
MTREEIQADAETQVVPRPVADRLARIVERYLINVPTGHQPHMIVGETNEALDEYRKAVAG